MPGAGLPRERSEVIAISYHDRVNVLQEAGLQSTGPFDRAEWFTLLAESSTVKPLIVLAQKDDAKAALVLRHTGNRLEPLANWYSFAWRPLMTPDSHARELVWSLAKSLRSRTSRLTLWPLPDEDGSAGLLERAFQAAGWVVTRKTCDMNHILPLQGRGYAAYLASRPGPLRTTLRRKAKRIRVQILHHFDEDMWHNYEAIYARSWKPEEGDPEILRRFAKAEGDAGRIRLAIAYHGDEAIAAQFWTVEGDTAFIHKLAHLQEFQHLSAGTVLTAALMEEVIDRDRVNLVDFGTGDDAYKRDWMDDARPRFLLDCYNPGNPASWPHLAVAALRRLATRNRQR